MERVLLTTLVLGLGFGYTKTQGEGPSPDPITFMPTDQVIDYWGYKGETHYVTTEDGYILGMHRIANNPNSKYPPVFLQGGLLTASDLWVLRGPEEDMAFMLADLGYDVWMGNARGSTYSKNHTTLSPKSTKFWQFSWHEMGYYDLPAEIDYILEKTKKPALFYVGHSMGTTQFYVMASARPEYNDKIVVHFSLAPVCFMGNMKSNRVIMPLAKNVKLISSLSKGTGLVEFFPRTPEFSNFLWKVTHDKNFQTFFWSQLFEVVGTDWKLLNMTIMPTYLSHLPSGCSVQTLEAYGQTVLLKDKFNRFDYGPKENMQRYGSTTPPPYNLTGITARMALVYSYNDYFSHVKDVKKLASLLPNVVKMMPIRYKKYNHVDYIWGMEPKKHYVNQVIETIKEYTKPRYSGISTKKKSEFGLKVPK